MASLYRDNKTGEVFENIDQARRRFCNNFDGTCKDCVIYSRDITCAEFASHNPEGAAIAMGYSVEKKE